MRQLDNGNTQSTFPLAIDILKKRIETKLTNDNDLSFTVYNQEKNKAAVFYLPYLVDQEKMENQLLHTLLDIESDWSNETILNEIPLGQGKSTTDINQIIQGLVAGDVYIYVEKEKEVIFYNIANVEKRSLGKAETESIVLGPQLAFTESLISNINILSWRLNSPDLVMEKLYIGERFPKETRIIYMKNVANDTDVNTMRKRLTELEVDTIEDIHRLKQYILDSSTTLFPLFATTELVDRAMYTVKAGKIIVLVEDSPLVMIAPSTFFSFFESTEDLYLHWNAGTLLRVVRFLAAILTVLLTPMYIAATTYHYELIPTQLLISIGQSRASVPFPPILEVLFLELMIELLKEAGARLPTKIGQTIGIVGGVVVGTAAVQAGLTSNILIILVTMSALASFTTPSYLMGNTIRLIRFPLIILSGLFGIIGIVFGGSMIVIHLIKLRSLGRPYLTPLYPLRLADFNKVFFRFPIEKQGRRFLSYRLKDKRTFSEKKAHEKKDMNE
ncbi:spore germination protein [Oceanobacillus sp. CAU 1775]